MGACFLFKERSVDLLLSLTQRKKQRNIRPTKASPQGEDATDYGGKPPCVRILVWLTKPVPLRGEPWSFYRLRREKRDADVYRLRREEGDAMSFLSAGAGMDDGRGMMEDG